MLPEEPPQHFEIVPKRAKVLKELQDEPLIIELKDNSIYGGSLDGYEEQAIWLYDCQQPADDKSGWVEQTDRLVRGEEGTKIDRMPEFSLLEIRRIYRPKNHNFSLDDALSLWLDPLYRPLKTIKCPWDITNGTPHSSDCDKELHEALKDLFTAAMLSDAGKSKPGVVKLERALKVLHRFIIEKGGKIP